MLTYSSCHTLFNSIKAKLFSKTVTFSFKFAQKISTSKLLRRCSVVSEFEYVIIFQDTVKSSINPFERVKHNRYKMD